LLYLKSRDSEYNKHTNARWWNC